MPLSKEDRCRMGRTGSFLIGRSFKRTCVCSTLNDDQCLSQLFQRDQKAPSELTILQWTIDNNIASIQCNKTLALHR